MKGTFSEHTLDYYFDDYSDYDEINDNYYDNDDSNDYTDYDYINS